MLPLLYIPLSSHILSLRSSLRYRQQAKLFTDAMDESHDGDVADVTEAYVTHILIHVACSPSQMCAFSRMQDIHIQEPNLNVGILDFETPGALCDLLRESYKSLPVLQ